MVDTNSDVSLDMSEADPGEDTLTNMETDHSGDDQQLTTVRTKMANIAGTEELLAKYPSESMRVRSLLAMSEETTTEEVLREIERAVRRLTFYEDHRRRLQEILSQRAGVGEDNLIAKVEQILVENEYHKVQAQKQEKVIQQLQEDKQDLLGRVHTHTDTTSPRANHPTTIGRTASMTGVSKPIITPRIEVRSLRGHSDTRQNQVNLSNLAKRSRGKDATPTRSNTYQVSAVSPGTRLPEIAGENGQREGNMLVVSDDGDEGRTGLPDIDPQATSHTTQGNGLDGRGEGRSEVKAQVRFDAFERVYSEKKKRPPSRMGRRRSTIHWEKFLADMTRGNCTFCLLFYKVCLIQ